MKTPTDLALAALNGFKWLGNNLHNIRSLPDQFESFYKAALDDAEKAIAALTPPKPAWQLPAPPAGQRWHREEGWTEQDLPEGYRPLLYGEMDEPEDEELKVDGWQKCRHGMMTYSADPKTRTRRPLPSAPKAEPWDSPEDVPGPVCWIRRIGRVGYEAMIIGIGPEGVERLADDNEIKVLEWARISTREYSTDRKEWKPCTKEAKA